MRKAGLISQAMIEIAAVIAINISVNVLPQFSCALRDLTAGNQFTLAESSRRIMANVSSLPGIVYIRAYVSPDLPAEAQAEEQQLRDLLEEYQASASSNLTIEFIDPGDLTDEEKEELESRGIQAFPIQISGGGELTVVNAYFALEIEYMGEYDDIPFVPSVPNLEYEITLSVLRLTSESIPKIGFLTGHGELSQSEAFPNLSRALSDLCEIEEVRIENGQRISSDIDTLVIVQPTLRYTERERYVVDQFLMGGGKLVVMSNAVQIDPATGQQATFAAFPLESLLSAYGVKINSDLVADRDHSLLVQEGSQGGPQALVNYPLFPAVVAPDGFPSGSAATWGLEAVAFPFVSSLQLLYDRIPPETRILELAKTSTASYSYPVPVNLSPQPEFIPPGGEADLRRQLVAVELDGLFTSAFAGQPVPPFDPAAPESPDSTPAVPTPDTEPMVTLSPETSLVVIGNGEFITDGFAQFLDRAAGINGFRPENETFFLNLLESLTVSESLGDIRTREDTQVGFSTPN